MSLGLLIVKIALLSVLFIDACHYFICFGFTVPKWEKAFYALLFALVWML
jgi:hypothetical protein